MQLQRVLHKYKFYDLGLLSHYNKKPTQKTQIFFMVQYFLPLSELLIQYEWNDICALEQTGSTWEFLLIWVFFDP